MTERDPRSFGERFDVLRLAQLELERLGYLFYPVPREHIEAGVTDPLRHRIAATVKRRGFEKLAGRLIISYSGYVEDEREIFAIPEIRAFWRKLDHELPELPALVAYLPAMGFNGPGFHLMLLGTIDEMVHRPEQGGFDVHVMDADTIIGDALRRIERAATAHHLRPMTTRRLLDQFMAGATHRFPTP